MYKLLVVEDEEIIRYGIIHSVPWQELGFEIMGQVTNGNEGLDFIRYNKPDVILTDVRMPLMDGLTMAERILKLYPEIKIVILSGFADFDYAQKAIRFKAFDYLLKPTDKNKFMQCFKNLKTALDKEQDRLQAYLMEQEKRHASLSQMREEFLLKALQGNAPVGTALEDSLEQLEIDFSGSFFVAGIIQLETDTAIPEQEANNALHSLQSACSDYLSDLFKDGLTVLAAVRSISEVDLLFHLKTSSYRSAVRDLKKCSCLLERALHRFGAHSLCALGLAYPEINQIYKSYAQAKSCFDNRFYDHEKHLYIYLEKDAAGSSTQKWIDAYPKESNEIIESVLSGSQDSIREKLKIMFNRFEQINVPSDIVKEYCCFLCFMLHSACMGLEFCNQPAILNNDYETAIKESKSISILHAFLIRIFIETNVALLDSKSEGDGKETIEKSEILHPK